MRRFLFLLVAVFFVPALAEAQNYREQLAIQFFGEGKYDRAAEIYEHLADNDPTSLLYYERLLTCYEKTTEFSKGASLIKKRKKKFDDNPIYKVDEAWWLKKQKKDEEAGELVKKIIKQADKKQAYYLQLAKAFENRGFSDEATSVLESAEQLWPDDALDFSSQVAGLYLKTGKREKGIEKYLDLLTGPYVFYGFEQIKNVLEMNLTDSADFVLLKNMVIRKIQKDPNNNSLNSLLRWSFIKLKDWNGAFVQTRALDKKLNDNGSRVMDLGELCIENEAWEAASKCFEYVRGLGNANPNYSNAVAGLLETRFMLFKNKKPQQAETDALVSDYQAFIKQYGMNEYTWRAVSRLAQVYVEYTHEADKAVDLLTDFTETPGINGKVMAQAKLQLGDALVITDDVWTSELLYAQVEKDFQEEPIGQEAKFRRARLSYYRGDFEWAQDQLGVLKSATTQTISNNAIRLSLLITENLGIDSNYDAMERFANSELLLMQNKPEEANAELDSIVALYAGHSLSDDILYMKGQIKEKQGDWAGALELYDKAAVAFNFDILADNCWYRMGMIYMLQLNDKEKAKHCFEKIVLDFPGSLYQIDARKFYRQLRGDAI